MAEPPMPQTTRPPGASTFGARADSARHRASPSWCGAPSTASSIPWRSTAATRSRESSVTPPTLRSRHALAGGHARPPLDLDPLRDAGPRPDHGAGIDADPVAESGALPHDRLGQVALRADDHAV